MSLSADERTLIEHYGLEEMPLEGGMFRRIWRGATGPDGKPVGSAIIVLLSARTNTFSAMHRLPTDEIWHFYLGDPLELLLLHPDGSVEVTVLGRDLALGQHVVCVVPAGTWMGGHTVTEGGWSLVGCTMAPGFVAADYEGGATAELTARYPSAERRIRALVRDGAPLRHPR